MNEINGAEIDEVVDEKVTEKVEKGANFLPAWVLEMRSNLSQSQAKLNNACLNITKCQCILHHDDVRYN